ncbi:lysophospholipid acyltransferase family protein [Nocardioides sp. CN2-186]|uniref:lysophospholipid acyltransferase family protein n=1 Tax=Nocardioides tweenelious TaxID=3156607 RepID=UPI0032B39022
MTNPHLARPRSDQVKRPARYLLHPLRPLARWIIRRRYDVQLHRTELVPPSGAVIFASNHVGVVDGPLLAIFAPRPVHALTKVEMFRNWFMGPFLRQAGQIPLDRFRTDPAAVKMCLRVLRDGGTIGIYPEGSRGAGDLERFHRGAAYLALVSGATVIPVTTLGSREPGGSSGSLPHRGAVIDLVFGEPYEIAAVPWPRTREQVEKQSLLLREHMLVQLDQARALTGRELPGPLPAADVEPDPDTGVTDQGAP